MKTLKNIYRLALCLTILAMVLSAPASSPAASSKSNSKGNGKNGHSNANNSNAGGNGGGNAATTAAAAYNTEAFVIPANDGKWHTVLTTSIKNPTADDDLFIDVAQVSKITTTAVTSTSTANQISSGNAKLQMRVLVDGVEAKPGAIVFDERLMQLTSNLQSFLSLSCTNTPTTETIITTSCVCNPTIAGQPVISCQAGVIPANYTQTCSTETTTDTDVITTCSLVNGDDQSLSILLDQTIGHSFDFLAPGVGGMGNTHTIQLQVKLTQLTTSGGTAQALIGPGTLKITAVNLKQ
ncbi:MAG: hypothetical protein ACM3TN_10430 [Alphaproteobacteria bacterium]